MDEKPSTSLSLQRVRLRDAARHSLREVREREKGTRLVKDVVIPGLGAAVAVGAKFGMTSFWEGVITVAVTAGVASAIPAYRFLKGLRPATLQLYEQQLQPILDAKDAELRTRDDQLRATQNELAGRDRKIADLAEAKAWHRRMGVEMIPLRVLPENEATTVQTELEKAKALIMEAAGNATSALRICADKMERPRVFGPGVEQPRVFGDSIVGSMLQRQAGRLGRAQDELRDRLVSEEDARQALYALCMNYRRTNRCIEECVSMRRELAQDAYYERFQTSHARFMSKMSELLDISPLNGLGRYLDASADAFPL